jgi:drug/metabolite transporter (DMT)-like permease
MRFWIVGVPTVPFFKIHSKRNMLKIFYMGCLQSLTFYGIALGVRNLDSSMTAIFARFDIVFTIMFGILIFKEKFHPSLIIGILLSFSAIIMLNKDIKIYNTIYMYGLILAAFTASLLNVISKSIKDESNIAVVSWCSFYAGVILLTISCLTEKQFVLKPLHGTVFFCIFYVSVFASFAFYLVLFYLLRNNPTTHIMPYSFIRPIMATIAGFILHNDPITINRIIGICLIASGIFVSEYARKSSGKIKKLSKA